MEVPCSKAINTIENNNFLMINQSSPDPLGAGARGGTRTPMGCPAGS